MLGSSLLIILVFAVQGVPVCEWGKYGQNCDQICSDQCRLHPGRNLRHCQKDTGKCSEGCVRGRHGDHCDQLCSPNCINNSCIQLNGACTKGCIDGYSGYFCNISTVQGVPVCEWGKYGHNCDRLCSDQCRLHPVRNLRHCQKYTGKCSEGCVRGRHGDLCDQLCSQSCINNSCIQRNGGCTLGCTDGYSGYYCNISTVSAVQGVTVCEWGKYGQNCDRLCSDHCGLHLGRNLRPCHKDNGKCLEGCVRGRHGDRCDQLCSPNCISTKCNQPNGGCTLGCIDGYIGQFCNRTTGSQIQTTGEGHSILSMQLMWMFLVFFFFSTICCWKSAQCRRRFDKWFTRLIRSARCIRTLVEWFTRLIRRNPRPSSSDPRQVSLVTAQDSDRRASSDPSWDPSQSERDPLLSTASHASPSPADRDLYFASEAGNLEEVKRLLSTPGVDVNSSGGWRSRTPVMAAAVGGHRDVVELLVKEGADVSLVDGDGNNTLHLACQRGDVETVQYVLSLHVVDINSRGWWSMTPVMEAALWGHRDMVELLVKEGADVSLVDEDGNNTLHLACRRGDVEIVKFVLSLHVVDINSRGGWSMTPVMEAAVRGHREVVELLVKEGADVSLVDGDGNNILHLACRGGDVETVEYVLSLHVVDIDARNESGETAADWARLVGHQPLVELLMSRGAQ